MQWNEEGILVTQPLYVDGKQHGLSFTSHSNGQRRREYTWKDGKRDGPYTSWYDNGQKGSEGSYKKGKRDGKYTRWHRNGQKWAERTHRDGVTLSQRWWNSKGEEAENEAESADDSPLRW